MFIPAQLKTASIIGVRQESVDTKLFRLVLADKSIQKEFDFLPGQFMQVGLAGWGECPISICSSPVTAGDFFELAIRSVGSLTRKLNHLGAGDVMLVRGPFGNGFDLERAQGRPLLLVGGGCGFLPLRPLINDFLVGRLPNSKLQIFYGCFNEDTLLFRKEHHLWNRRAELKIILEKPSPQWKGRRGLVTDLFKNSDVNPDSMVIMVGPPIMYKFVMAELKKKKIKDEDIFLSLERKMYCGVGVCQHCAIGPYYVCKDGPVFCWQDIKNISGII
jgi:NAD(P)H-flavin reductase